MIYVHRVDYTICRFTGVGNILEGSNTLLYILILQCRIFICCRLFIVALPINNMLLAHFISK